MMSKTFKKQCEEYQLRYAAGSFYLLEMKQPGMPYKRPLETNEIGAEIWKLMAQGENTEQIIQKLSGEYDADEADIREDVLQFFESLKMYGVKIGE